MSSARNYSSFKLHRHYLWFACVVSLFLFLMCVVADLFLFGTPVWSQFMLTIIYLLIGATPVHAAIWTVFGAGRFVYRVCVAVSLVLLVVICFLLGIAILLKHQQEDYWTFVPLLLLYSIPALMAAQIPFWIMRTMFGWQFIVDKQQPTSFSIKHLFVLTFAFAITFAIPSIATKILIASNNIRVGSTQYIPANLPDGTVYMDQVEITNDNIEEFKQKNQLEAKQSTNLGMLSVCGCMFILSIFTLPIVAVIFGIHRKRTLLYLFFYGLGVFALITVGYIPFVGTDFYLANIALPLTVGIIFFVLVIAWPLAISKVKGIELYTNRSVAQLRERKQNQAKV